MNTVRVITAIAKKAPLADGIKEVSCTTHLLTKVTCFALLQVTITPQ
jgi:hypothetical protein